MPLKWASADWGEYDAGRLPEGESQTEWSYGDLEAGFREAALVLDETFSTPNNQHHCLESRSALAYWQNGKLIMHTGTQSAVQTVASISRWMNIPIEEVTLITEYTGGGFGSKATGAVSCMIPAMLARKTGQAVMMRITREEEQMIGGLRPAVHGRIKAGFASDGRILAIDMMTVGESAPYEAQGDAGSSGRIVSLFISRARCACARRPCSRTHRRDARRASRAVSRASCSWSRSSRRPRASSASIRSRFAA
jgi:CO/xanthine dehydrogenase Mo-binding subunit